MTNDAVAAAAAAADDDDEDYHDGDNCLLCILLTHLSGSVTGRSQWYGMVGPEQLLLTVAP